MQLMDTSHSSEGSWRVPINAYSHYAIDVAILLQVCLRRDLSGVCTKMFPAAYCNQKDWKLPAIVSDWNRIHIFSLAHMIEYSAATGVSQPYNNDKEQALTCNVQ